MKDPKRYNHQYGEHGYCPKEWDGIPVVTGNFQMDAVIAINNNSDIRNRLAIYCASSDTAYGPITGYDGYSGYSGDN
jgi:hypothetical protein